MSLTVNTLSGNVLSGDVQSSPRMYRIWNISIWIIQLDSQSCSDDPGWRQFSAYVAHANSTSTVDCNWCVPSSSQQRGPSRLPYERTAAERLTREGCSSGGVLRASEGRDRCYSRHFNFSFPGEGETKTKRKREREGEGEKE